LACSRDTRPAAVEPFGAARIGRSGARPAGFDVAGEEWFAFWWHEAEDHPRRAACVVKLGIIDDSQTFSR
jgi:hypothetical protein